MEHGRFTEDAVRSHLARNGLSLAGGSYGLPEIGVVTDAMIKQIMLLAGEDKRMSSEAKFAVSLLYARRLINLSNGGKDSPRTPNTAEPKFKSWYSPVSSPRVVQPSASVSELPGKVIQVTVQPATSLTPRTARAQSPRRSAPTSPLVTVNTLLGAGNIVPSLDIHSLTVSRTPLGTGRSEASSTLRSPAGITGRTETTARSAHSAMSARLDQVRYHRGGPWVFGVQDVSHQSARPVLTVGGVVGHKTTASPRATGSPLPTSRPTTPKQTSRPSTGRSHISVEVRPRSPPPSQTVPFSSIRSSSSLQQKPSSSILTEQMQPERPLSRTMSQVSEGQQSGYASTRGIPISPQLTQRSSSSLDSAPVVKSYAPTFLNWGDVTDRSNWSQSHAATERSTSSYGRGMPSTQRSHTTKSTVRPAPTQTRSRLMKTPRSESTFSLTSREGSAYQIRTVSPPSSRGYNRTNSPVSSAGTVDPPVDDLRLLRLWEAVNMPNEQRVAMVEKYTQPGYTGRAFADAIAGWERAIACIGEREQAIKELAQFEIDRLAHSENFTEMSIENTRLRLMTALNHTDNACRDALSELYSLTGDVVTVNGNVYAARMDNEIFQVLALNDLPKTKRHAYILNPTANDTKFLRSLTGKLRGPSSIPAFLYHQSSSPREPRRPSTTPSAQMSTFRLARRISLVHA